MNSKVKKDPKARRAGKRTDKQPGKQAESGRSVSRRSLRPRAKSAAIGQVPEPSGIETIDPFVAAQAEGPDPDRYDPYLAAQAPERTYPVETAMALMAARQDAAVSPVIPVSPETPASDGEKAEAPETGLKSETGQLSAQDTAPDDDQAPAFLEKAAHEPEGVEKWEHTKKALRKHFGEPGAVRVQKDPHEVVEDIMKRIRESRRGEEKDLVVEPPEAFPASQDGTMRMSDVMSSRVACVTDSTTVEQLAGLFNKRHIMAAPIIHYQSRRFLGLITMEEIFSYTFTQKMLSVVQNGTLVPDDCLDVLKKPVRDFMDTQELPEIAPDCPVQEACRLMVDKQLHHLVVTRNHKVKGIFSAFDALRVLADMELRLVDRSASENPQAEKPE
ncbi:MAG TPA: CBS domain-containing protein [Candidatus Obscuribacterales bacterium]